MKIEAVILFQPWSRSGFSVFHVWVSSLLMEAVSSLAASRYVLCLFRLARVSICFWQWKKTLLCCSYVPGVPSSRSRCLYGALGTHCPTLNVSWQPSFLHLCVFIADLCHRPGLTWFYLNTWLQPGHILRCLTFPTRDPMFWSDHCHSQCFHFHRPHLCLTTLYLVIIFSFPTSLRHSECSQE